MKWFFALILAASLLTSCDNELVVTDTWKDIPVVWGLLSKSDTAHYIRVEKAFLDPTTSALEIAQRPDSLYYEDATVTLTRISSGQVFTLTRVNGDLEGYPRDSGIFASIPNYLYKIKADQLNLVVGEDYKLTVDRNDNKPLVTAETVVLPKPVLRNPVPGAMLSFRRNSSFTIQWNEIPEAGVYDVLIHFHYRERSPETGAFYVPKSFEWVVQRNLLDREVKIDDGTEFYTAVKANIAENSEATRLFDSLDIIVWAGGKELAQFIEIAQANFGLTSTQDIPTFTNLSEGVGIFSSRNVSVYSGFQINDQTLDSLRDGSITKDLNFN